MPRPHKCRRVCACPQAEYFKPRGVPVSRLREVILTIDEFEAMRLADLQELYQEAAAQRMRVSRQTFGNIIMAAHKKLADVIVNAKALKIEGGRVSISQRKFRCPVCKKAWELDRKAGLTGRCPACKKANIDGSLLHKRCARAGGTGKKYR